METDQNYNEKFHIHQYETHASISTSITMTEIKALQMLYIIKTTVSGGDFDLG